MSTINRLSMAAVCAACITIGTANAAKAETLIFDELGSPTPVDGLTVSGVTFDFKIDGVDSNDAIYNSSFPPGFPPNLFANLQQPLLDGNGRGILTLDFAEPASELEFAVGLETFAPTTAGLSVELFTAESQSLGITPVNTSPQATLSEGLFTYSGEPVTRAVLDFDETQFGLNPTQAPRFSLDNLSYTSSTPVPEASSLAALVALGALGGSMRLLRKQRLKV
jgi:hypothetical protein